MTFELTNEQRWEILNNLPQSLKEAVFSEDTAEAISSICSLHDCEETSVIGKIVGQSLMGLLPPKKISQAIKTKLPNIPEPVANNIAIEIQHYILDPIMDDINSLYTPEKVEKLDKDLNLAPENTKRDSYRESV